VNDAQQCLCRLSYGCDDAPLMLRESLPLQHFDHAEHAVHRRSDFVTHGGEEGRLRQVGGRGLTAGPFSGVARGLADGPGRSLVLELPDVLDRDCRLIRERSDQLDLLVGKWPYLRARQCQNADWNALTRHWNPENGAEATQPLGLRPSIVAVSQDIGDVNNLAFEQCSPVNSPTIWLNGDISDVTHELGSETVSLCAKELAPDLPRDAGLIGLAQSCGRFDQRLKHRLEIESRAADDLEHIGSRRLLLQGVAQLVEQASVLDGDDSLVGEVLDQLDLLVAERTYLCTIHADGADNLILLEHGHES